MAKRQYVVDGGTFGLGEDPAPDETEEISLDEAFAKLEDMFARMEAAYAQLEGVLERQTAILQSLRPVRDSKGRGKEPRTIMAMNTRDAMRAKGYPESAIREVVQLILKTASDGLDRPPTEAERKATQRVMRQDSKKLGQKGP